MSFGIPVRNGLAIGLLASTTLSSRRGLSPALFLDFLQPYLDSRITFSRGTGATRVNASGFIETVGNTTPRFDYDPVTLAPRGLLIEEARTNLALYSQQFDDASWIKVSATVTANATASPDGTTNADALFETATTAEHQVNSTSPTFAINTAYTFSAYVKSIGGRNCSLFWYTNSINTVLTATFDLTAGTIVTPATASGSAPPTSVSASITPAGNGWYRVTITGTTTATAGAGAVRIHAASGTSNNYAGDVTKGIFIYGAQLEAGTFATSYIPTVASTVSRSADVATMTGTNFSSWYNAAAGTFIAETSLATAVRPRSEGILGVSNGSSAESTAIYRAGASSSIKGEMLDGGAVQASYTVAMGGQPDKSAFAYELNNSNFALNGAAQTTDTACTLPTVDRLIIGSVWSGGDFPANGHIRAIAYYNTRLPNTQLQTLTAPSLASPLALDFISPTFTVGY
jgi:hypothetical protein